MPPPAPSPLDDPEFRALLDAELEPYRATLPPEVFAAWQTSLYARAEADPRFAALHDAHRRARRAEAGSGLEARPEAAALSATEPSSKARRR